MNDKANRIVINGTEVSPEVGDILLTLVLAGRDHGKKQYIKGLIHGAVAASVGVLLWYAYGSL